MQALTDADRLASLKLAAKIVGMARPKHVFLFDWSMVEAVDPDTVCVTVRDLREMGLYRLPYDHEVYIQIIGLKHAHRITFGPLKGIHDQDGSDNETVGDLVPSIGEVVVENVNTGRKISLLDAPNDIAIQAIANAYNMQDLLIVLLATKNVEKSTKENKLKGLGIGKRSARGLFDYVTRISLPSRLPDDEEHLPTGGAITPHLRRGHIRRQHHGAGNLQVKKIWIAPIFVNADPAFVHARKAYKIMS